MTRFLFLSATCRLRGMRRAAALLPVLALAACGGVGREASGLRSPSLDTRLNLAQAAEASGQNEMALSLLQSMAEAEPNRPEVQARYAAALVRSGNLPRGEAVVNEALSRHGDSLPLLRTRAQLLLLQGKAAEAAATCEQILAAAPRDVAALDGRGVALDLQGQHAAAQASYRAATRLAPENAAVANNLALSLILDGRPAEAVAVLGGFDRPDAPPRLRSTLALALAGSGEMGRARERLDGQPGAADLDTVTALLMPAGAKPVSAGS
ncbi:tetratricopeptide repeat protein [Roseomonas elaeocarpi]|uniref:Tetratricopeptide repeat protein n=1 Tax=Roseomonas elaeocarpi TaxID=907779 RepID=A0ABV6JS66_9PROT